MSENSPKSSVNTRTALILIGIIIVGLTAFSGYFFFGKPVFGSYQSGLSEMPEPESDMISDKVVDSEQKTDINTDEIIDSEPESSIAPENIINTDKINLSKKYTYTMLKSSISKISDFDIVKTSVLGKTVQGRNIFLLQMGTGSKKILITAGTHARETANTPMLMQSALEIIDAYYSNGEIDNIKIKQLLSECTLYFVPLVNPDGYAYCLKKQNGKKKTNAHNVDLNRNFPTKYWGSAKGVKKGNGFAGKKPASEPETQAIIKLVESMSFDFCIDIHSRGRGVFFQKFGLEANDIKNGADVDLLNSISRDNALIAQKICGYKSLDESEIVNGEEGSLTDYLFESGVPTITLETVAEEKLPTPPKSIAKEYEILNLPAIIVNISNATPAIE